MGNQKVMGSEEGTGVDNRRGTRPASEVVAEALVEGIEAQSLEVVRAGEVRMAMIAANRDHPETVDERFRGMKSQLEEAVSEHRSL